MYLESNIVFTPGREEESKKLTVALYTGHKLIECLTLEGNLEVLLTVTADERVQAVTAPPQA